MWMVILCCNAVLVHLQLFYFLLVHNLLLAYFPQSFRSQYISLLRTFYLMSEFVFLLSTFYCGQLILLGVCCSGSGDGMDPYAEVSLQPLPEYTIPSDGVTMTCITCTDRGHVFLAGRDGHIYELQYTTGSGWHKRCRKVCLTAGLGSVISRYHFLLNTFKSSWL